MPHCYYVTTSSPEETARELRDCVSQVGGPGEVERLQTDGRKLYAWVRYAELHDAMRYLAPVKRCMEEKGHVVHDHRVVHDFEELGFK